MLISHRHALIDRTSLTQRILKGNSRTSVCQEKMWNSPPSSCQTVSLRAVLALRLPPLSVSLTQALRLALQLIRECASLHLRVNMRNLFQIMTRRQAGNAVPEAELHLIVEVYEDSTCRKVNQFSVHLIWFH